MEDLSHLAVVKNRETGQFCGAYYRDHPTPSGSHRLLLAVTTDGCDCGQEAARVIKVTVDVMVWN